MTLRETFVVALRSLRSNRLRSLLTTLGIIIGVAAVIVLVALGNGVRAGFDAQFSRLANQITVSPATGTVPGGGVARPITDQDVAALQNTSRTPDIASVTPSMTGNVSITAGQATEKAQMVGATYNYLDISARTVAVGNWFTEAQVEGNGRDVLIGQQAAAYLFGDGVNAAGLIGKTIRLNHTNFKVVGVLGADGQNDNVVIVPFGAARAYLVGNANQVSQLIVKSTSVNTVKRATAQLQAVLDARHFVRSPTDRDYNIRAFQNLIDQRSQFITFLTIFTAAVAAISLVVGGIGVANIMLVAVTERTREIGIRKAIGAPRRAILKQFLTEAVLLTGLGGLIGVALGVSLAVGGGLVLPHFVPSFPPPIVTALPVLLAFGVSLVIGLVAGGYPANRAAGLRPIEALRFE
ncbi:MAG TPA: ABC transporter permease [Pseudonocardia sp.]|jgi:putative ABC transport system permease protein